MQKQGALAGPGCGKRRVRRTGSRNHKRKLSVLIAALQNKKEEMRGAVVECLILLGPDARDALPALRTLRQSSEDSNLKKAIGEAMEEIEKPKKKTMNR